MPGLWRPLAVRELEQRAALAFEVPAVYYWRSRGDRLMSASPR